MKKCFKFLSILFIFPLLTSCSLFISRTTKYQTKLNFDFYNNIDRSYINNNRIDIDSNFELNLNKMLNNATFFR